MHCVNDVHQPRVHKFGGSSLADKFKIAEVVEVIKKYCMSGDLVVLSAMGNTTNMLLELIEYATAPCSQQLQINAIKDYQQTLIRDIFSGELNQSLCQSLCHDLNIDLEYLVLLLEGYTQQTASYADIVGFGELWSTRLMTALLLSQGLNGYRVDSREFICVNGSDAAMTDAQNSVIDWDCSQQFFIQSSKVFKDKIAIISGYIATDKQGATVTLGRNGSDFSATIIAKLANAQAVYLWTDVNGVFSADPNQITNTQLVPELSMDEAIALASLGTSVFHQNTLQPLKASEIRMQISNTSAVINEYANQATLVLDSPVVNTGVKILAYQASMCLFKVQWVEALSTQWLAETLLDILDSQHISYWCWSQQAGQISYCVEDEQQQVLTRCLTKRLNNQGYRFSVVPSVSIISTVGSHLTAHKDELAEYFDVLEQSSITVLQRHQQSEHLISLVVDSGQPVDIVNVMHEVLLSQSSSAVVRANL